MPTEKPEGQLEWPFFFLRNPPMASPRDLLLALARAYTLAGERTGDDPELAEALATAREVHAEAGWQVIRLEGESPSVNREPAPIADTEARGFLEALAGAQVTELRLQEPIAPEVLLAFLRRLKEPEEVEGRSGSARFRGFEGEIGLSFHPGNQVPPGMAGSIVGLFQDRERGRTVADVDEAGGGEPSEGAPALGLALSPELERLVSSFLSSTGPAKVRTGEAIVAAAARLGEARDERGIADLVEVLGDASGPGERDPDAMDLAVRLTSPRVAIQLVGRLGSTREESERNRLIRVSAGLGREMAAALADALGEARDRYQRRSFMDALLAMGEIAREMAEGMVEDPRWYVVRNGVALLGEMGGPGAVSNLTGTLANEDPRVRKETVLALSKIGGDDAAMLLLGMLDDSDPEVRARACSAVGLLRVERALKPLLQLLEKDSNEEVQVQGIQALGKIGDPGAVPFIEKKAVGRLFSRPSKEIRIAAYRALAGIGTPHARRLLLKATKDSDMDVRKLALGLMD